MLTSLKRTTRAGYKNLRRQLGLTFVTVSVLVMTIFLLSFLIFVRELSNFLVVQLKEKADISVYFKQETAENEILQVKDELSSLPEVKEVNYVSREEALEKFSRRHQDNPVLMEALQEVGDNPLLASLNVKAWQANQYEAISQFLEKDSFKERIYKVNYKQNRNLIDKVFGLSKNLESGTLSLILIFGIISVSVAFNTVKLAIYNNREEISIMRLVGARNWFIRGPFMIQGAIMGVIAGVISLLVSISLIFGFNSGIREFFSGFDAQTFLWSNFWSILLVQFGLGLALGVISSYIAVRKHLRV